MGKILRDVGYSKYTSLKPKLVTESQGYKSELARIIPDWVIANKHSELLNGFKKCKIKFHGVMSRPEAKEIIEVGSECKLRNLVENTRKKTTTIYYWSPDYISRLKAIDMYYRIRGYYKQKQPNTLALPGLL